MIDFDKLYLSWRKGQGFRRHIVGKLEKSSIDGSFSFCYLSNNIETAKAQGFTPYTEFPNTSKIYSTNILGIFGQRLIKAERPDIKSFYDFWEIDLSHQTDMFYLLGHTQAKLPTDNFEFLAEYKHIPDVTFVTDLAGLSGLQLLPTELKPGDLLTYELELDNEYDKFAVGVFKDRKKVGFIKKIHCKFFHHSKPHQIKLEVKAVDKNGLIKQLFVKVQSVSYSDISSASVYEERFANTSSSRS